MAGFNERTGRRDAGLNNQRRPLGISEGVLEAIDRRTLGSPNAGVIQTHGGQIIIPKRKGRAAAVACALGDTFIDGSGDLYFRSGTIAAGALNATVGGDGTTFTPAIGDYVWAEVTFTATVADGMLTGAGTFSLAALDSGSAAPTDHAWTDASASGKSYRVIGRWIDDGAGAPEWEKLDTDCGQITFYFCATSGAAGTVKSYRG